ncbi:MAG: hypothetical protein ACOX9R_06210 [Armatimonadota bacterium]|jgi:hypothetical protein
MNVCRLLAGVMLTGLVLSSSARAQVEELPPLVPAPPAAVNLLADSGFEEPGSGAWQFSDWPPREDTGARLIADSIRVSDERAFEGERCLVLDLTTVGAERTLIAQQRIAAQTLASHDGSTVRLSARVLLGGGPPAQQVTMTMRQWGDDGLLSHQTVRIAADLNEWTEGSRRFTLRMGATTRADVNVSVRQSPNLDHRPVVYLDDVRLEVLAEPALAAELPWGDVLMAPDDTLPVVVRISQQAWDEGLRGLRWDLTGPDGSSGYAHGEFAAQARSFALPVAVNRIPNINEGRYALRLALGSQPGERRREVLLPFTRAEGPLAR